MMRIEEAREAFDKHPSLMAAEALARIAWRSYLSDVIDDAAIGEILDLVDPWFEVASCSTH